MFWIWWSEKYFKWFSLHEERNRFQTSRDVKNDIFTSRDMKNDISCIDFCQNSFQILQVWNDCFSTSILVTMGVLSLIPLSTLVIQRKRIPSTNIVHEIWS